jgi:transcriptional regulator with XRE-family HTH domain
MGYQPLRDNQAVLRDRTLLETAMRERDLNGRDLAKIAETSPQTISQLRKGMRQSVSEELARRLERTLRVETGHLFRHRSDRAEALAS